MIEIDGKQYKTYEFESIDQLKYIGFIYVTINKCNNKMYIGQHTGWFKEYLGSGIHFKYALRKYGRENFKRYIIDFSETQEELDKKETFYINEEFNAAYSKNWYNIKAGSQTNGNAFAGMSEERYKEACRKMSESTSGEKNPFYGKHHSKETKEKIRIKNKGKTHSEEVKKKIGAVHKGKKYSDETKKKIALGATKYPPIILFKDDKKIGEFSSLEPAVNWLQEQIGGKLRDGILCLTKGWKPSKRSQLYGYSAKFIEER